VTGGDAAPGGPEPDVTVIIPVYNTMPYLRRCLDSVLGQSLGPDRLQVVAVDDGSTDGSGELLDEVAAQHPTVLTVLHQPNSGGPASPCNRGLDRATGRWVFFLGADDHLSPTALARLVSQGDLWDSDVIFGTMQGENGRFVDQRIYRRTAREVTFEDSALAYSLSNTKLFRRSLLEEHRIRYALDLRVGSDQPFVVEALTRARRVSVLTDQVYYHAVRRDDAGNITYSSGWRTRLDDIAAIIRHIAAVVEEGPVRDAILTRHFTMELGKLIRLDLIALEPAEQRQVLAGIADLVGELWTDGLQDRMGVLARLRIRLAATGQVDLLRRVLEQHAAATSPPPLVLRTGAAYSWYPGFDTPETDLRWYRLHRENLTRRLVTSLTVSTVAFRGGALQLTGRLGVTADSGGCVRAALLPLPGPGTPPAARRHRDPAAAPSTTWFPVRLEPGPPGQPTVFRTCLDPTSVLGAVADGEQRHAVQLQVQVGAARYDLPVPWTRPRAAVLGPLSRAVAVSARPVRSGRLVLTTRRMPARAAARLMIRRRGSALLRRLPWRRRGRTDLTSRGDDHVKGRH
jgi:glycosyltransferase involved in cell wall biosynthesis